MILKTDSLGIPRFTNKDLIDLIYSGNRDKCHVVLCEPGDDVDQFNKHMEEQEFPTLSTYIPLEVDQKTFDSVCQNEWLMPDEYKNISDKELWHMLIGKCTNTNQVDRVIEEYDEYERRNMLDLLKFMMYLVDFMREKNIVWGVGRGSSVSSYILYLIGIHKVDSFKYNLDWREFLK
jgi:DNA polymerase III alpha subunit